MKRFFNSIIILSILICFNGYLSAETKTISDYTNSKVVEFITTRVILKSEEDMKARTTIENMKKEAFLHLRENAIDYEQEARILEGMYFMEIYMHSIGNEANPHALIMKMKEQMDLNTALLNRLPASKVNKWLYVFTGDITSFYMTRSIQATLLYGLKVKSYYEKALQIDPLMTSANISLGNWLFYAPPIFGGRKKSKEYFLKGIEGAKAPGDFFIAYEYLSQVYYEEKNMADANKYMDLCRALNIGTKELDLISKCNSLGYSYYQYMRNASGIDVSETETSE